MRTRLTILGVVLLAVQAVCAQQPLTLNLAGNSLSDGLVAAWHFGLGPTDLVSGGSAGTLGGGAKLASRRIFGQLLVMPSAGDRWDLNIPTRMQVGQPCTLVVRGKFGTASNTANHFGIFRDGSNYAFGVQSIGSAYWMTWSSGASGSSANTGVSELASPEGVIVVRYASTFRDFWLNGILKSTVTGSYSDPTYSGTPKIILGSSLSSQIDFEYVLIYNRLLESSEIETFNDQPYAWLAQPADQLPSRRIQGGFSPFLVGANEPSSPRGLPVEVAR